MFVASAANMVGRISTGFITFWKLWLLNAICFACFVYEVVVAAWPGEGDFPITPWLLVPITIISSGLGGYISTQVTFIIIIIIIIIVVCSQKKRNVKYDNCLCFRFICLLIDHV